MLLAHSRIGCKKTNRLKNETKILTTLLLATLMLRAQTLGSRDTAFQTPLGTDQAPIFILHASGKTIVTGAFATYSGVAGKAGIARLNADGNRDPAFTPAVPVLITPAVIINGNVAPPSAPTAKSSSGPTAGTPKTSSAPTSASTKTEPATTLSLSATSPTLPSAAPSKPSSTAATLSLPNPPSPAPSAAALCASTPTAQSITPSTSAAPTPVYAAICPSPTGALDTTFNLQTDCAINDGAVQSHGKLIIAGQYTTIHGQPYNQIARINLNGSLDTTWNPAGTGNAIGIAMTILPDGKLRLGNRRTSPAAPAHFSA